MSETHQQAKRLSDPSPIPLWIAAILCCLLLFGQPASAGFCKDEPICGLPIIDVIDSDADGDYDQDDILAALEQCEPGCNLHFLSQTYYDVAIDIGVNDPAAGYPDYFPDGFAMYGNGQGQTILRAPVYDLHLLDEENHIILDYVIHVGRHAPDGLYIQDMTLDGVKDEISPPTEELLEQIALSLTEELQGSTAIYVGFPGAHTRYNGTIRRVEIKDFVQGGIELRDAADWTIRDNTIHDIGCHVTSCRTIPRPPYKICDGDVPCGPLWDEEVPDVDDNALYRKTSGAGINISIRCTDNSVEDNEVYNITKVGIATFMPGGPNCDEPEAPTDTKILRNTVWASQSGIYVNGGCRTIVEDNVARNMRATGMETQHTGFGIACVDGGEGSEWRRNVSWGNQGVGYYIGCSGGDLIFEDNASFGNCQRCDPSDPSSPECMMGYADVNFNAFGQGPVDGLWIRNHQTSAFAPSNCRYGMYIADYDHVCVSGGEINGGLAAGIRLINGHAIDVRSIAVQNTDTGIRFEPGLSKVYVQDTTELVNVVTEASWNGGGGPDDGDSVALCELETGANPPDPQGCLNLPDGLQRFECSLDLE